MKAGGRRQRAEVYSYVNGVLTPTEPNFSLKEEVLNQRDKLEVNRPFALCPLP
jgi:hypothetical protein